MLYRRTPSHPPTLLLRIVATAGASTLLGIASCGGETSTVNGLITLPANETPDAQAGDSGPTLVGAIDMSDSGAPVSDPGLPCGVCGLIVSVPEIEGGPVGLVDASVADGEVLGIVALPEDAGPDAHHVIIGVVVEPPDAGHDSGSTLSCPPLCGIVIGVVPNPGH
jgi:hypothetical protein